jgi:hypothetical protein
VPVGLGMADDKGNPDETLEARGWLHCEPELKPGYTRWTHADGNEAWVGDGRFLSMDAYEFSPAELRAFAQLAEESGS